MNFLCLHLSSYLHNSTWRPMEQVLSQCKSHLCSTGKQASRKQASHNLNMYNTEKNINNIDSNVSLELITMPKPGDKKINEEIKAYEKFIDKQLEKLEYEKLKKQLYDDILEKVMNHVRSEVFTSTNIDSSRANRRKRLDDDEKNLLISHLKDEISFLKEEICQKNHIINKLTENSSMRDKENLSHRSKYLIFAKHDETVDINELQSQRTKAKHLLEDQLIAIRLQKHNEFIKNNAICKNINGNRKNSIKSHLSTINDTKDKHLNPTSSKDVNKKIIAPKNVIVCGDSMVNGIESNGISSKEYKAIIRSFSGSTSKDFIDYVKPLVLKKPDVLVIHVGTNDLTKNVNNTIENIQQIVNHVREISEKTKVVLSNICYREDRSDLNGIRNKVNTDLKKLGDEMKVNIIDNGNIDQSCLARKKLHLNKKGLAKLSKNIKSCLRD